MARAFISLSSLEDVIRSDSVGSYAHHAALGLIFSKCSQLMEAAFLSDLHKLSVLLQCTHRETITSRWERCTRRYLSLGSPKSRLSVKDLVTHSYLEVTPAHAVNEEVNETREGGEPKMVTLSSGW